MFLDKGRVSFACCDLLIASKFLRREIAEDWLSKNAFLLWQSYFEKLAQHETAETAKPWVEQALRSKDLSANV